MMKPTMTSLLALAALAAALPAFAYIGPGAGLSLVGALWAVIAAVGAALFFIVAWPLRRMLRRRREQQADAGELAGAKIESPQGRAPPQGGPKPRRPQP
jgi:membrane protein implicated in regulation of membrane protease activity